MESLNNFSRVKANIAKAGAYFTDVSHCRSIGTIFDFPDEEMLVLEPSCGDGKAVRAVTADAADAVLFGVELNGETYSEVKKEGIFECIVNADYLSGTIISNNAFSFAFMNPPYGDSKEGESKDRLETRFVVRATTHLCPGAELALVIPDYVARDVAFARQFLRRFTLQHVFKFREPVYQQFKQCVLICMKKEQPGFCQQELEDYNSRTEEMPELPEVWSGEKVKVLPSCRQMVRDFRSKRFDEEGALELLAADGDRVLDRFGTSIVSEPYKANDIPSPIMPLSRSHLYLMSISGAGEGAAGSEEELNYHLQRGTVVREKTMSVRTGEGGKQEFVEIDHASNELVIIEQNTMGCMITHLRNGGASNGQDED